MVKGNQTDNSRIFDGGHFVICLPLSQNNNYIVVHVHVVHSNTCSTCGI